MGAALCMRCQSIRGVPSRARPIPIVELTAQERRKEKTLWQRFIVLGLDGTVFTPPTIDSPYLPPGTLATSEKEVSVAGAGFLASGSARVPHENPAPADRSGDSSGEG